jgi:DNA mismatch repair protein MutL
VASSGSDVVLVDPHAAHEKVLYAQLLDAWSAPGEAGGRAQLLLVPAVVECDASQMQRFAEHADLLRTCGFDLEELGPGLLRCAAVPGGSRSGDVARLLIDALEALDPTGGEDDAGASERRHRLAATVACHAAVRFGDPLGPAEQQGLLDQLAATPGGTTCPHGRPALLTLDRSALRRAFGRPLE